MTRKPTRRKVITATGGLAVLGLAGYAGTTVGDDGDESMGETETNDDEMDGEDSSDEEMNGDGMDAEEMNGDEAEGATTFTVRIENVAPADFYDEDTPTGGAILLTPGAYAVHAGANPIFTPGESASAGLEALAEAGTPDGFPEESGVVDELEMCSTVATADAFTPAETVEDPNDPEGDVPGAPPIAPGGAFEFEIEAEPGQRLSFASMFVPSNDAFVAPGTDGISLFDEDGTPTDGDVTDAVDLWDAGTEPNAEPPGQGPDQAPAQDSPDQGDEENGVVCRLADDGHEYPDVSDTVSVTVTPR